MCYHGASQMFHEREALYMEVTKHGITVPPGNGAECTKAHDNTWEIWPVLASGCDPLSFFLFCGVCYCNSHVTQDGLPIRPRPVEKTVCAINSPMASLGATDTQLVGPNKAASCGQEISTATFDGSFLRWYRHRYPASSLLLWRVS